MRQRQSIRFRPACRRGVSLLETLVVITIVGILLAMFFPAVQMVRERAIEMGCKNNLRQINLAIADYHQANNRLPDPAPAGQVGGWTIEALPFLEQMNLKSQIRPGTTLSSAPDFLLRAPAIYRCPIRNISDAPARSRFESCNYVLVPPRDRKRGGFMVLDAPLVLQHPWANGLEMSLGDIVRRTGPHRSGFFCVNGYQDGVEFREGGR